MNINVDKLRKFKVREEPHEITLVLDSVQIKGEVRKLKVKNSPIISRYANVEINEKYYGKIKLG